MGPLNNNIGTIIYYLYGSQFRTLIIRFLISLLLSPHNYACVSGPDMVDDARDHSLIEENGIESVLPL